VIAMKSLLLLSALVIFTLGVDYCSLPPCLDNHIACNNKGMRVSILYKRKLTLVPSQYFGGNCPKNSIVVNIRPQQKLILSLFNEFRNNVAGGRIKGLPKAVRMAKMSWSDELSYLALLNVRTCESTPDKCRSTERFAYAGQNNAIFSYGGAESWYTDAEILKELIENWFAERSNASPDILANFPEVLPNKNVAKFTIAVAEKNTHVGCAAVRFFKDFHNHFVLTCNFATSNIVGYPVYTTGEKSTSGCKNPYGAAYDYPNLCYATETYDNEVIIGTTFWH
ncbi:hypothetical protein KR054_009401, partial [Drosophila jambulina]